MKLWNPNEWQGRSEKQVERNNKTFGYTIILGVLLLTSALIYKTLILLGLI